MGWNEGHDPARQKPINMLRKFLTLFLTGALVLSCSGGSKEDPIPEPEKEVDPEIHEPDITLNPRVDGRCALAYVTYYGSELPDVSAITHINYAFAELYLTDNVYQKFKVQGSLERFRTITMLKNNHPELKICLSFTNGIANSDNRVDGGFSALVATEDNRKRFAEDCLAFLKEYSIDGIDLDWEFPGLSWGSAAKDTEHDTANYVLLVKQLRETLGTDYLITYAGYCMDKQKVGQTGYRYVDIAGMDPYVDYVNIMTYDLDEAPHHHSALSDTRAYRDCNRAVNAYLNAGIQPNKLVVGVPFYGRISFSKSPTAITYRKILQMDRYKYRRNKWDDIASCPFVEVMENNKFYCGYDNPRSIAAKGAWARAKGLYGLMFWEYDQDDSRGTLRKSIWNAVMQ